MAERVDWDSVISRVHDVLRVYRDAGRQGFSGSWVQRKLAGEVKAAHVLGALDRLEERREIYRARTRDGYRTKKRDYVFPQRPVGDGGAG